MIIRYECLQNWGHSMRLKEAKFIHHSKNLYKKQGRARMSLLNQLTIAAFCMIMFMGQIPLNSMAIFNCLTPTMFRMQHKGHAQNMQEYPFAQRTPWNMYPSAYESNVNNYPQQSVGPFSMK